MYLSKSKWNLNQRFLDTKYQYTSRHLAKLYNCEMLNADVLPIEYLLNLDLSLRI